MAAKHESDARALVRGVAVFQFKLLLDAGRDLVLSPIALGAALIDLVLLKWRKPTLFRIVLGIGRRSEHYIDVWSDQRHPDWAPGEDVDALLASVEQAVRDPEVGARRARVLKRWAERQLARARQRATSGVSARLSNRAGPDRRAP